MTKQTPFVVVLGDDDQLTGFGTSFWGRYVRGFDARFHCQPCLIGRPEKRIHRGMRTAERVLLDARAVATHPYFYVCGVTFPQGWEDNFHLACRWESGRSASKKTFNGFEVTVAGAIELEIPPLEPGFAGAPEKYTTCRNWQFGVEYFGLPEGFEPPAADGKIWKEAKKARRRDPLTIVDAVSDPKACALARRVTELRSAKREDDSVNCRVYLVPSSSGKKMYRVRLVDPETGKAGCDCIHGKHWKWAGARCVHVKSVMLVEAGLPPE